MSYFITATVEGESSASPAAPGHLNDVEPGELERNAF